MLLFLHPLCPCQREVLQGLLPLFLRLRVEQDKETWLPPQVVIPTCSESFFNCFALSHCFSEGFSPRRVAEVTRQARMTKQITALLRIPRRTYSMFFPLQV